jgi:hypothetical protein
VKVTNEQLSVLKALTVQSSSEEIALLLQLLPALILELQEHRSTCDKSRSMLINNLVHYGKPSNWKRDTSGRWIFTGKPIDDHPGARARSAVASALHDLTESELKQAGM